MVQTRDIHETRPRFECAGCHERFWISYPECSTLEEVMGLRIDDVRARAPQAASGAPAIEAEKCPKCAAPLTFDKEECTACGVIPKKFLGLKTAARIQGSERLSVLWKKIIDDYGNDDLHREFIKVSSMENNLAYASAQYAQLLKLIPQEERAVKMIAEIGALVAVPISFSNTVRIQSVKNRAPRWVQGILIAGGVLVAAGIFFPFMRNLTGLGAVLVFLALGWQMKLFKI